MGGDEFVLLAEIQSEQDAILLAQNILKNIAKKFNIAGQDISTSLSIGISIFPRDGQDIQTLIKKADLAMYQVKKQGKNNYHL